MGGALTRMMHEGNGGGVIALQAAQIGEQGGDFRGDVLVDGVQTHQRVKQDEVRPEKSHGRLQGLLVLLAIEPQRRHGDDMDIEALEFDACGMGNALETTSDDLRGILGGKQQDASGSRDLEVAQTRRPGGDRDGEIKRQKRFADLRFVLAQSIGQTRVAGEDDAEHGARANWVAASSRAPRGHSVTALGPRRRATQDAS